MTETISATVEHAPQLQNAAGFVQLTDAQLDDLDVTQHQIVLVEGASRAGVTVHEVAIDDDHGTVALDWLARHNAGAPCGSDVTITVPEFETAEAADLISLNSHLDVSVVREVLTSTSTTPQLACSDTVLYLPDRILGTGRDRSALVGVEDLTPSGPVWITAETDLAIEDHPMVDRPRGVLSPADRVFLTYRQHTDEKPDTTAPFPDYEDPTSERIRQRIQEALSDFQLLVRHLSDQQLDRVFDSDDHQLQATLQDTLVFLLLGLEAAGNDIELRLGEAISHAVFTNDQHATVNLDVLTEDLPPPDVLLERFQRHGFDGFTRPSAIDQLFQDWRVDAEALATAYEQAARDADEEPMDADAFRLRQLHARRQARTLPSTTVLDVEIESDHEPTTHDNQ